MNNIIIEKKEGYIVAQMNRGRANALNADLISELRLLLEQVENDDSLRGIVLTGQRNFFSAGLDVVELITYNEGEMLEFWYSFSSLIYELAAFQKILISAITGYSPAGGCLIAIASDYRVMAEDSKFMIGLNEVPVGILLPHGFLELYAFWIGMGKAYQAVLEGKLFNPQEALAIHLVDEIVSQEEVLANAEKKMKQYLKLPSSTLYKTKKVLRRELLGKLKVTEEERKVTIAHWHSDEPKFILQKMVGRLKPNKKA